MEPLLDLTKIWSGAGWRRARGAYQIGAWTALEEAGVKVCAVAGTSVGALNGALICMDSVENAQKIWAEMKFPESWMWMMSGCSICSAKMEKIKEVFSELWKNFQMEVWILPRFEI